MTLKKYANQLAVNIIEKRGSEDSNIWEDVENYFSQNPRIFTLIDNSIGGEVFENWVRDKLELLYKIEYNILPNYRKKVA
jgi:hypothetical protein